MCRGTLVCREAILGVPRNNYILNHQTEKKMKRVYMVSRFISELHRSISKDLFQVSLSSVRIIITLFNLHILIVLHNYQETRTLYNRLLLLATEPFSWMYLDFPAFLMIRSVLLPITNYSLSLRSTNIKNSSFRSTRRSRCANLWLTSGNRFRLIFLLTQLEADITTNFA